MGDIADDTVEGLKCSWCGVYFIKEHGYPVACKSCWKEYVRDCKNNKKLNPYLGVQKALFSEI